jgi:hypothetical protein
MKLMLRLATSSTKTMEYTLHRQVDVLVSCLNYTLLKKKKVTSLYQYNFLRMCQEYMNAMSVFSKLLGHWLVDALWPTFQQPH